MKRPPQFIHQIKKLIYNENKTDLEKNFFNFRKGNKIYFQKNKNIGREKRKKKKKKKNFREKKKKKKMGKLKNLYKKIL